MTLAVCMACGSRKFGAFLPCPECGHVPATPEEQAKAMILSDHVMDPASLDGISASIRSGQAVDIPEDVVREWASSMPTDEEDQALMERWRQESERSRGRMRRCMVGLGLVAIVALGWSVL
jgi:hypothetical protein